MILRIALCSLGLILLQMKGGSDLSAGPLVPLRESLTKTPQSLRIATWNIAMNFREAEGITLALRSEQNQRFHRQAEIIQRLNPDILLLNEWDASTDDEALKLFLKEYLSASHNGSTPIDFEYYFTAPVNTGEPSGLDLDGNGTPGSGPGDAYGYGTFPGQYSMVLLSKFPIQVDQVRTFQNFKWSDMPDAIQPMNEAGASWYPDSVWKQLRLSSKSHWDIPIQTKEGIIHVLASHPTPPVFDGPEDRNGRRNHDEIRFWADYVHPDTERSEYIYDDQGRMGGLRSEEGFVIMGDLNADPNDGDSYPGAIELLLKSPQIQSCPPPISLGGKEWAIRQGGANLNSQGASEEDTADFNDRYTGNLRVDYVLPSRNQLKVLKAGVFWPEPDSELERLFPLENGSSTSDHRPVWLDLKMRK